MAVEDVFTPKSQKVTDVKGESDEKKPGYWEKAKEEARAKREFMEELELMNRIQNPPATPEPPIKITGGISLGNIDIQEQQRQAREEAEKARKDKEDELKASQGKLAESEEKRHGLEMENVKTELLQKIEILTKAVEGGRVQPKPFKEQYDELLGLANSIGLAKPNNGIDDPRLKLEMLKMQAEMAREEREFKWRIRQDDKNFQIEMAKMAEERLYRGQQLEQARKKDEMIASAPEILGRAIAQGLKESGGRVAKQPLQRTKSFSLEVGEGQGGEIECPQCQSPIGIHPTARTAVCSSCNMKIPIKRVPSAQPEEPEE